MMPLEDGEWPEHLDINSKKMNRYDSKKKN